MENKKEPIGIDPLRWRTAFLHSKKRKAARCARDGVQSIFAVQKLKLAFFN